MTFIGWSHGENWASYSHDRLYAMVRTEADIAAVAATEAEMGTFRALMDDSVDDVEQALAEAGVSWQGLAAESMNAGVSPLAQWARDAAAAADASGSSARDVGETFRATSHGMPEPVPTPSKTMTFPPTAEDLIAAQQDQDAAERDAQNAKRHAVELMETYSTNSAAAQDSVGTFVPPQSVTVGPPEPEPDVISVADDAIEGSSDGGDPAQPGDSGDAGYRGGPVSGDGGPVGGGDPAGRETTPGSAPPPGGTDPARVTSPPNRFPPVTGPGTAPVTGGSPVTAFGPVPVGVGDVGGRGTDRAPGGGRGPGGAPGSGGGGTGRGPAAGGTPGRGGAVGAGPLAGEPVGAARGGAGAAVRPGTGMGGFGPMGAGRRDDEDKERTSPEYLRDFRDDFWDTTPPVAPPVIGEEEDD
jgi:hypothetical protein